MSGIFVFDIETLGIESTAAIASMGMVHYDDTEPLTYANLIKNSIYLKLDTRLQIKQYGRTTEPSTLAWWKNQSKEAQKNIIPASGDLDPVTALQKLSDWIKAHNEWKDTLVFTRGGLDQLALESLGRATGQGTLIPYYNFRDIRTLLDCFYPNNSRGQAKVNTELVPDFNMENVVLHDPVHDCAKDACMILAGM